MLLKKVRYKVEKEALAISQTAQVIFKGIVCPNILNFSTSSYSKPT